MTVMMTGKRPLGLWLAAAVAVVFGLLTIKSGGTVLFTEAGRVAAGHYVEFVVWFNFMAGFAYVIAGLALIQRAPWAPTMAAVIAVMTLLVFAAFGVYVLNGGSFEQRTVGAMTVRSTLWVVIAFLAYRSISGAALRQPT